jgi:hypothetical protein
MLRDVVGLTGRRYIHTTQPQRAEHLGKGSVSKDSTKVGGRFTGKVVLGVGAGGGPVKSRAPDNRVSGSGIASA